MRSSSLAMLLALSASGCTTEAPLDGGRDAAAPDATDAPSAATDAPLPSGFRVEPPLPHPLQEITAVTHGERIVVAGGIDEGIAIVTEVWAFDGASWTAMPALPAARHHAMLVSLGTTLYLVGGMESLRFEPLDTVFALPDGASAWESRPPLPRPLAAAVGVVVEGELVLAGGQTDRGLATATLIGDPETGVYRDGAAIPAPREHVAGLASGGEVWVTGGRDFTPSTTVAAVEIYDVAADAWRSSADLSRVRGGHSATLLGGSILVAGGEIEGAALDGFEWIDPETGALEESGTLPTPRHGHAAAVLDGRIYLIGGADRPLFGATLGVESWGPR